MSGSTAAAKPIVQRWRRVTRTLSVAAYRSCRRATIDRYVLNAVRCPRLAGVDSTEVDVDMICGSAHASLTVADHAGEGWT
jgi:hypothetical protein